MLLMIYTSKNFKKKEESKRKTSYVHATFAKKKQFAQLRMDQFTKVITKYGWGSKDQIRITNAVGTWIIAECQPFNVVEKESFKNMFKEANERYDLPSRTTFSTTILDNISQEMDNAVQRKLKYSSCVVITTDIWTARHSYESFIAMTGHFIDQEWAYHSAVLSAQHFPESHTGANITEMLNTLFEKHELPKEKVKTLVSDSAPAMILGCKETKIPHLGCILHQINIAVTDALNCNPANKLLIQRLKNIVRITRKSQNAKRDFENIKVDDEPSLKMIQDVAVRWFSTFYMFRRFVQKKGSVCIFLKETEHCDDDITNKEWKKIENFVKSLEYLEETCKE